MAAIVGSGVIVPACPFDERLDACLFGGRLSGSAPGAAVSCSCEGSERFGATGAGLCGLAQRSGSGCVCAVRCCIGTAGLFGGDACLGFACLVEGSWTISKVVSAVPGEDGA
ncbi:hypothetical protein O982_24025 [Mycobacterium avium 10-5581]|nr:hypothetical protein O982_24025 [Mycobacterium avium 10-5581]